MFSMSGLWQKQRAVRDVAIFLQNTRKKEKFANHLIYANSHTLIFVCRKLDLLHNWRTTKSDWRITKSAPVESLIIRNGENIYLLCRPIRRRNIRWIGLAVGILHLLSELIAVMFQCTISSLNSSPNAVYMFLPLRIIKSPGSPCLTADIWYKPLPGEQPHYFP